MWVCFKDDKLGYHGVFFKEYYYTTNDVTSYITLVKTSGQYIHILTAHKLYINLPEILFYSIYVYDSVIYYGFHP